MGIKRVKLNYKPYAARKTNEIAYVVDLSERLYAINKSLDRKAARNRMETQNVGEDAKDYIVKNSGYTKKLTR